jgi:hypothetical protein
VSDEERIEKRKKRKGKKIKETGNSSKGPRAGGIEEISRFSRSLLVRTIGHIKTAVCSESPRRPGDERGHHDPYINKLYVRPIQQELIAGQAPSGMYLSEPVLARVRFLLALLIDLHAENMADWADRWARGRVDSPDKNRAPRAQDWNP